MSDVFKSKADVIAEPAHLLGQLLHGCLRPRLGLRQSFDTSGQGVHPPGEGLHLGGQSVHQPGQSIHPLRKLAQSPFGAHLSFTQLANDGLKLQKIFAANFDLADPFVHEFEQGQFQFRIDLLGH